MKVTQLAGIRSELADPNTFKGGGQLQRMLLEPTVKVYRVSFDASARTNWHSHSGIQLLIIDSGECWLQKQGEAKQFAKAGDVVMFAPNEAHWHGASKNASMVHYAINIAAKTVWGNAVSDGEYES